MAKSLLSTLASCLPVFALACVVAAPAQAAPAVVTSDLPEHGFGLVAVGSTADATVTLSAGSAADPAPLGDLRLAVGALGLAPVGLSISSTTCTTELDPDTSCTVTIRFAPTGERTYTAELVVGNAPLYDDVFARVSGTGFVPPTPPPPPTVWPPLGQADPTSSDPTTTEPEPERDLRGTLGNDAFPGTDGIDRYRADYGNDRIFGGLGADRLYGEGGNDLVRGGAGDDVIDGGAGVDRLFGEAGADTISGGDGNDRIDGGGGNDRIDAGAGNDVIQSRDRRRDVIRCGAGRDRVVADRSDIVLGCEVVTRG